MLPITAQTYFFWAATIVRPRVVARHRQRPARLARAQVLEETRGVSDVEMRVEHRLQRGEMRARASDG